MPINALIKYNENDTTKNTNIEKTIVEIDLLPLFLYTRYALYKPIIGESIKKNQDKNVDILSPPEFYTNCI